MWPPMAGHNSLVCVVSMSGPVEKMVVTMQLTPIKFALSGIQEGCDRVWADSSPREEDLTIEWRGKNRQGQDRLVV